MTSRACCVLLAAFVGLIHTSGASLAEEPPREPWTASTTVGEVVARRPATARIFELVGIDYCCGGETTLTAAAEAAGVDPIRLLAALAVVGQGDSSTAEADWTRKSSREIVQHVLDTHHVYLRGELPRIARMAARAARVHGERTQIMDGVPSATVWLAWAAWTFGGFALARNRLRHLPVTR